MEKVITIFDWWDGPLCGLASYKGSICIYERIFDEIRDEWSDEYYLTPIEEADVNTLLRDWNRWRDTVQNERPLDSYKPQVQYSLPFDGEWYIANGGVDKETSHS